MSARWNYKVVEIKATGMFSGVTIETIQTELDKYGAQGWELVQLIPSNMSGLHPTLVLKREQ